MKLLKPTWVNHNGECAQRSREVEPRVRSASAVRLGSRLGPAWSPGARCLSCSAGGSGLCPPHRQAGEPGHVLPCEVRLGSRHWRRVLRRPPVVLGGASAWLLSASLDASQVLPPFCTVQNVLRWSRV
jgi:hypothetical protein